MKCQLRLQFALVSETREEDDGHCSGPEARGHDFQGNEDGHDLP